MWESREEKTERREERMISMRGVKVEAEGEEAAAEARLSIS